MKAAAVVNPRAAGGASRRRWSEAERLLAGRIGRVEVRWTEARGGGAEIAKELAGDGFDPILAAGGDGTLSEVVEGVLASGADPRVGIVPIGGGNDFARGLGLRGMREAVEAIAEGGERRVDALRARFRGPSGCVERHAVNVASVGLGARAAYRVASSRGWARAGYLAAAAYELARGASCDLRLSLDGGEFAACRATTLAFANGPLQGGGIRIAPGAELDDGMVEVTLIEPVGLVEMAGNLRRLYSGALYGHAKVRHWRASRLRVEAEGEAPFEIDGEPAGRAPVEIEVRPGAWRLLGRG